MGCVQSKSAQSPATEVLPTSVKVANSTKNGVAPGNPGQPTQTGDPIYLDRADTWGQPTETPLDNSAAFQIKSEGNEGLQEYVADVKASNRPTEQKEKAEAAAAAAQSAFANTASSRGSFDANGSPVSPPQLNLEVAESLPSQLSLAQAQPQRDDSSLDGAARGGKVTLPPLPPGVIPRKPAASAGGVSVSVLESDTSLPGSTGAPTTEPLPLPLPLVPSTSDAALEGPNGPGKQNFRQMNADKSKGFAKRAQFGSMYMPAAHSSINRPTYAQDAVDEDNADAKMSGIFSMREQGEGSGGDSGSHRGGYQAFSSMVFAQGGVPQQHVTANDMPSPETDVQRNDLAPDASLSLRDEDQGGGMGSLTGWQALANEIMMEGEEEEGQSAGTVGAGQSRDMGSLTGWQALANEVIAELGSGPQPGSSQDQASAKGYEDEEEEMQPWNNGTFKLDASRVAVKPVGPRPLGGADRGPPKEPTWTPSAAAPGAKKGGTFYIQYETLEELGEGAFGKALKCRRRRDNQIFVVKIMHESKMSAKAIEEAKNEVKVLNSLNHPNIVKYYECYQERNMMHIIMEFCQEGDLDSAIKKYKGYLPEDDIMLKFVQIALALHYTHSKGIIHRDLKANNIFCSAHGIVKLGDFGISKALGDNQNVARTMVGTPYYMSPEILKGKAYDGKTDVWAIGCVLYEMCALKKAFDASNLGAITVKVMSGKFPPIPAHYSNDLKELVEALIKKEPEARPSLQEILDLAYVRRHMQLYRDHVARHITERQTSFQRSLSQFNLEAMAQAADGGPAAEGGAEAAALQAHLDSAMQAGLIQINGVGPSGSDMGGPGDPARDGGQSAGPSDRPRAPGGGGRARRKSGIIMSELGAGLRVPGSNASAAAAAAAEATARRGAEAAARQAHRNELRQKEEAQALLNLRAFKDSIKAAVSRVGSTSPPVAPSASSASGTGFSTGLPTPTVSATAARRSRFGGYSSRSLENLAALDVPAGDMMAGQVNRDKRFSLFNSSLTRGNKEETADDEDTSPDYRTDSLDQLQQKVPNLMAQMNGIAQNPTTTQIPT
ncbi:hypothetical protein WJX77_004780 [Trebouxia sp. C0004]